MTTTMPSLCYHVATMRALLPVGVVVVCVLAVSALQSQEAVTVEPVSGIAGHYGTWTVTYTVGPGESGRAGRCVCSCPIPGTPGN